jgi:hypothetical protein
MPVAALVLRPDREFEESGSHRFFTFLSLTHGPSPFSSTQMTPAKSPTFACRRHDGHADPHPAD